MGFFSGTSDSTSQTDPWGPSKRPLKEHLGMISGQDPWSVYGGEQLAGFNEDQLRHMQGMRDWMGAGGGGWQGLMNQGQGMLGNYDTAQGAYNRFLGQGPVQNQGPNMGLVNSMIDNDVLNGQIDAANRDVSRGLYENQLPGIAAYSGGTGNLGSSRRGMLEGQAIRGAGDRMADTAAGMRGQAYGNALNYANQISSQNAALNQQNRGMQMGTANQLMGMGGMGMNMMNQGMNMFGQGQGWLSGIGNQQQQWQQQLLNNQMNNHYLGQMLPYQQAQMGTGIAMGPGAAFGETTQTTPNGGIFGSIMQPIMGMAGAYMGGGGKFPGM